MVFCGNVRGVASRTLTPPELAKAGLEAWGYTRTRKGNKKKRKGKEYGEEPDGKAFRRGYDEQDNYGICERPS